MFIDTSASMCWECVFIETSASMCCECVCAFVSDYASVCSLIQVRPCVVSVCVTLLVIMLVCVH